jgi:CheY-like chemotaxis protein
VANAVDGVEAVEKTAATAFDLILTDISMPRMDGIEATRRIRQQGACRDVPIIGVTANADPDRMPEFLAAGMNDVLVKPVTRNALMTLIANHARRAPRPAAAPVLPAPPEPAVLNKDVFRETLQEMGVAFVERIADRLLVEVEALIDELDDHVRKGNHEAAAKAAHKTAGAAAAIGLSGLQTALSRYETAARNSDTAAMADALDRLRSLLPRTLLELRENGLSLASGRVIAQ